MLQQHEAPNLVVSRGAGGTSEIPWLAIGLEGTKSLGSGLPYLLPCRWRWGHFRPSLRFINGLPQLRLRVHAWIYGIQHARYVGMVSLRKHSGQRHQHADRASQLHALCGVAARTGGDVRSGQLGECCNLDQSHIVEPQSDCRVNRLVCRYRQQSCRSRRLRRASERFLGLHSC